MAPFEHLLYLSLITLTSNFVAVQGINSLTFSCFSDFDFDFVSDFGKVELTKKFKSKFKVGV